MVKIRIIESEPALVLQNQKRYLIISDLHIGFEDKFSSNKIFLGKNSSTNNIIDDIKILIKNENIGSLILLGDVKSSIKKISKTEWNDIPHFFNEVAKLVEIILVPGNHDANIQALVPDEISMIGTKGLVIDNVLLTHGHSMPTENFSSVNKIIMGHLHPVFFEDGSLINGQRVWISLKAKKELIFPSTSGEIEIIVFPSFNPYLYMTHTKKYRKSISPIIQKVKNDTKAKIITLDGTIIGNETILEQLI